MTESEYITVRNLSHIEDAERALRSVTPGIDHIITDKEYDEMVKKLARWRQRYYKKMEPDES